tara:strand:+ start:10288 stop:13020 length:2733 start_codon:yes stop_codon:yes gene_type:complete
MVLMVCSLQFSLFSVTGNVNVQFLLGDNENGVFEGTYNITFGIYPSPNMEESQALWKERHELIITQGKVSQILGTKTVLDYHLFKSDKLYVGLSFEELSDRVFVPLISVPASVVSKYSVYAREIEYTADWMKVNTQNQRVGIGITQNLTVPFQVIGSANITSVNATGELHSPDGYNVHQLDYLKLVNLDDYSLSPFDSPSRTSNNSPTKDVVFVTTSGNVGVGIYVTADITEQLHVSGNLKVDNGTFSGQSSMHLVGDAGNVLTDQDGLQLMWDSNKAVFRAGYSSGGNWSIDQNGNYSAAFGLDNEVSGHYGFSAGQDNTVNTIHGIAFGKSNQVAHRFSGILSGEAHRIYATTDTNGGYMTIAGGKDNSLTGDYGFIGGGNGNQVLDDSKYASIVGGKSNIIYGSSDYSVILGGKNNEIYGDYSVAMGKNAQIGSSLEAHDGVFMFADSTVQQGATLRSYYPNQFLVHAINGILFGLSDFNHKVDLEIDEFKTYPPSTQTVKDHTIRTAGDIVAADENGNLGYLVGDGTYITNVSSLWMSNSADSSVYLDTQRVGIGADNSAVPATAILYLKENAFPSNIRIESDSAGLLDVGVDGEDSVIESSNQLLFKRSGTDIFEITNNNEFYSKVNVGINKPNPEHALDIDGTVKITEGLESGGLTTSGTITANAFVGDGSGITDAQVSYMVPGSASAISGQKHLVMSNDGFVAIGQVALDYASSSSSRTVDALLHVGDAGSTQLKLEKTGDGRFTTMTSGAQFDLTFHNYYTDTDNIFSINSKKTDSQTSLVMVSAKGHVGILKDPTAEDALSVSGNVSATTFSGNGEYITNVQLDSDQSTQITFNSIITFKEMLKLEPHNHNDPPSCTAADVGSIYSIYSGDTNSGSVAICACIAEGTRKNLIDNTKDIACQ